MSWRATLALVAALAGTAAPAAAPPPLATLSYVAHWRLLNAGTATLSWDDSGGERHIHFSAESSGVVNLLFPVRDRMDTAYNPDEFCTTTVEKDTLEGSRRRQTHILYQPGLRQLVLDETDPVHKTDKHEIKPIPGCVLDLFGALDYVRSQPLRVGDVYNFPVNEGGATTEVHMTADLRETVVTPAGSFKTIRTEPQVYNSVFPHAGKMTIWFSDDARHVPVQVMATLSWGTLVCQLTSGATP